jgi:glycosyltransferase involved in cell wall biosynthesis
MIVTGGGADVLTDVISEGLTKLGWQCERFEAAHMFQYVPWLKRHTEPPPSTDLIATHSWFGPAFHRPGIPMVAIEHLFTPDQKLRPYRSMYQSFFHETLVRNFVKYSYREAAVTVAVSNFTRQQILDFSPGTRVKTISNGTNLEFFHPASSKSPRRTNRPLKLLYVGNLIVRKGVDMLPGIMQMLGDDFQLNFTQGLRTHSILDDIPNAKCLGKLNREEMRAAYQDADLLLFPSRMEGLPLAIIEAAACGLPAVATNTSSIPEAVMDGESGKLCERDSIKSFVNAIKDLAENPTALNSMAENARILAEEKFNAKNMVRNYHNLFEQVLDENL